LIKYTNYTCYELIKKFPIPNYFNKKGRRANCPWCHPLVASNAYILLSRIKLQTPVWRCSGSPKGSSSFFACRQKMPPAPAGGVSLFMLGGHSISIRIYHRIPKKNKKPFISKRRKVGSVVPLS